MVFCPVVFVLISGFFLFLENFYGICGIKIPILEILFLAASMPVHEMEAEQHDMTTVWHDVPSDLDAAESTFSLFVDVYGVEKGGFRCLILF